MASEEDHPIYNDDDLDESSSDSEPMNGAVPVTGDSSSSSDTDDADANSTAVTVAIPASIAASIAAPITIPLPDPKRQRIDSSASSPVIPAAEKKPIDDSRRLFQRLWTDEDEIELLQGFLEYTTSRGTTSSGHHHDTAAFYDQIKSKLQLEFNKNQLVEKLRRLKKKYRTVLGKMSSGKEFLFKSPHDQATFEISRKIWSNLSGNHRGAVEFDDDDQNPNPNPNNSIAATPPPNSGGGGFIINLNNAATPTAADHKPNFSTMGSNLMAKLSTRKRPRVEKMEDKFVRVNLGGGGGGGGDGINVNNSSNNNTNNNSYSNNNVHVGPAMQALIEETVRNCLSPMFKELINNAVNGPGLGGGTPSPTVMKGVGALASNAIPLNFPGLNLGNSGEIMDEKWRKQQILELEVYSKRLELVQDQIKLTLEELRSIGG